MWWLAIKAMLADRAKLITSLLGIAFSVVLVNLQGGLLLGLIHKASVLVDYGQADIWVGHRFMTNVDLSPPIPERWIERIRKLDGVERADRYVIGAAYASLTDGRREQVFVVGTEPVSLLGNPTYVKEGTREAVRQPDAVVIDAADVARLGHWRVGDIREVNGARARVVGMTQGINGFTTTPYVFTTLERARTKYLKGVAQPGQCSYFLVKAKPGVDVAALCRQIRTQVPELEVSDKATYSRGCMEYWMLRTGIGMSFGLAAFLGLLVGLAVVAQTLYAAVNERAREFGTLKALGADDLCVGRFLLAQAVGNAVLGSLVGLAAAVVIAQAVDSPKAPVLLTWEVASISVALILAVCLLAAWLPYWRIRNIDPASVLRS
jgi:putative ABC transport system permease protein